MSFLPEPPSPTEIAKADELLEKLKMKLEGTPNMKVWVIPILEKLLELQTKSREKK